MSYQTRIHLRRVLFFCLLVAALLLGSQPLQAKPLQLDPSAAHLQNPTSLKTDRGEERVFVWRLLPKEEGSRIQTKQDPNPEPAATPLATDPAPTPTEPSTTSDQAQASQAPETPLALPVSPEANQTSGFGPRPDPFGSGLEDFHLGIDFAQGIGSPIYAAEGGQVTRAGWFDSYGLCIDILHADGLVTRYAHGDQVHVQVGQEVSRGQTIAAMGATGAVTGSHLHFEVIQDGVQVDPSPFLP